MYYRRLILLLLFVAIFSYGAIHYTIDVNTFHHLTSFQPWSVIAALLSVLVGLFLDGWRLVELVRLSDEKITSDEAARVVFGNYFLALLTPGFSGGAVAQVMFLRYAKVPMGKAAVIVVVRTIVSLIFLFLCMPFILLDDNGILPWVSNDLLLGISIIIVAAIAFSVVAMVKGYFDKVMMFLVKRLSYKNGKKIVRFYRDNQKAIMLLLSSPLGMLKVFVLSGLSLIALYAVAPFLLMGLGAKIDWLTAIGRMIFLNLFLYFSPTPGGSGIAEGGFVLLFKSMAPIGTVGIVAVGWRFFAEYLPFFVGFYYTVKTFGREFLGKPLLKQKNDSM